MNVHKRSRNLVFDAFTNGKIDLKADFIPQGNKLITGAVNHFKIGGDPEYLVLNGSEVFLSMATGLSTKTAFGKDGGGGSFEIRPWASRSALEVVASTLITLRWFSSWLSWTYPSVDGNFQCSPIPYKYALGGHIHFGRRQRELLPEEILALDLLCELFNKVEIFDSAGVLFRRRFSRYGRFGDHRKQKYGYEYRVFPTWLSSPAQAMLVLTFAKLAVFDPHLIIGVKQYCEKGGSALAALKIIAQLFTQRGDQDSAICAELLQVRDSSFWGAKPTFGSAWGLPVKLDYARDVDYYPASIKPRKQEIELTKRAIYGDPCAEYDLVPNWPCAKLPKGLLRLSGTNSPEFFMLEEDWRCCNLHIIHGEVPSSGYRGVKDLLIGAQVAYLLERKHGQRWQEKVQKWLLKRGIKREISISNGAVISTNCIALDERITCYESEFIKFAFPVFTGDTLMRLKFREAPKILAEM